MYSSINLQRVGGVALSGGSLLFLLNKLDEMSRLFLSRPMADVISGADVPVIVAGQVGLVVGFAAYYLTYLPRMTRAGRIALGLTSGGGILLCLGHVSFISTLPPVILVLTEYMFVFVIVGLLSLLAGLIWFGVLSLGQPVLTRGRWLPLATGVMGFAGFVLFRGREITAVFLFFRTLFALGLFSLGVVLWFERSTKPAAQTRA